MNIKSINVVFEFEIDEDIILSIGNKIKEIQKDFNAKTQIINVPKIAPPDVPRLILILENLLVNIFINRYEYVIEIPSHISNNISSSLGYVQKKVSSLGEYLNISKEEYKWTGVVSSLQYPFKDKDMDVNHILTPIYDRLINIERHNKELSSFQISFGFKENDFYVTYTVTGYENLNFQLKLNPKDRVKLLDRKHAELVENGVSVIVDINNRPSKKQVGYVDDFNDILGSIEVAIGNISNLLNLGGLLNE